MASTVPTKNAKLNKAEQTAPPLQNGDHLTRAEFERRYHLQPNLKNAELIEGVVYVPSPVRAEVHGTPHYNIIGWIFSYTANTPGFKGADNSTLRLDIENEPQPDVAVWREGGGRALVDEDGYLTGAPELIIEIAASSAAYDLHTKKTVYRRNGTQEYLVLVAYEQEVRWFRWHPDGREEELLPDENGVLKSQILPGLWLHPQHFWAEDLAGMLSVLQQGLNSDEHKMFVDTLRG